MLSKVRHAEGWFEMVKVTDIIAAGGVLPALASGAMGKKNQRMSCG